MIRNFLIFLLILTFVWANAEPIEKKKNLTEIYLDEDISLSIANHQIKLNGTNDHVLIETPNSTVLLSNFNSIRFVLNSTESGDKDNTGNDQKVIIKQFSFLNRNLIINF